MVNCYIVVGKIKLYMSLSYIKIEFYYFNYYVIIARKINIITKTIQYIQIMNTGTQFHAFY